MKEFFKSWKPQAAAEAAVNHANAIIGEYARQGFKLTLRQLYYQFVARDLLNANTQTEYKRIGRTVRNARDAGLIDWSAIEDRTREVNTHSSWESPADIIKTAASSYRENPWLGQRYRPEVWIEKEALLGVIEGVCTDCAFPTLPIAAITARHCSMRPEAVPGVF